MPIAEQEKMTVEQKVFWNAALHAASDRAVQLAFSMRQHHRPNSEAVLALEHCRDEILSLLAK